VARFRLHRMPEPDADIRVLKIEPLSVLVGDASALRQPGDPALAALERPDQPPRHALDQRLLRKTPTPRGRRAIRAHRDRAARAGRIAPSASRRSPWRAP